VFVKGRWLRLQRGFHALCEALTVEGEESALHHFVQAIEALIKPGQYSNERLFWQRCRAFIDNAEDYERTLKDVYWIRCNIEHMHGPVAAYKDKRPAIDEDAFKLRLWQTQNLALAAYRGLLSSPELLEAFTDDDSIDRFWADEAAVARGWPNRLPLSRIGWREVVEGVKVLGVEGWEPISIHGPAKSLPW
jgi:hypothetical protein